MAIPKNLLSLPPKKRLSEWLAAKHPSVDTAILVFWASWCGPCRAMEPVIVNIAKDNPTITFVKVNTDEHGTFARECHINAIPTVSLFKNGAISANLVGVATTSGITQWLVENGVLQSVSTA